jgi:hypothetical protein
MQEGKMLSNKELEQLVREGEEILKEEEKKKRRIETLMLWLVWAGIVAGFIYLEIHGDKLHRIHSVQISRFSG